MIWFNFYHKILGSHQVESILIFNKQKFKQVFYENADKFYICYIKENQEEHLRWQSVV